MYLYCMTWKEYRPFSLYPYIKSLVPMMNDTFASIFGLLHIFVYSPTIRTFDFFML